MRGLHGLFAPLKTVEPVTYIVAAPSLVLSQHLFVAISHWASGYPLNLDWEYWFFPIRRLAQMPDIGSMAAIAGFLYCLCVSWWLAILSYRRANWASQAHSAALFAMIPSLQMIAVAVLSVTPKATPNEASITGDSDRGASNMLVGVLSGMSIIVCATAISALTFGSYGWGLFVMTPFLVGATTAYFCNRQVDVGIAQTNFAIIMAGMLGCLALLMLALEGFICILLIVPLAALLSVLGGLLGRAIARHRNSRAQPLMSVAVLPLIFAAEGQFPPSMNLKSEQSVEIDAPRDAVWKALTSNEPIRVPINAVGLAGLAYPVESHIIGSGRGAERRGVFSTGVSKERITAWEPAAKLTFRVDSQPPAMEEMSPYRKVHAPHVEGYFDTIETGFVLTSLPNGTTRLTARATHVLRIDPVLYWEPVAKWAIRQNVGRVLADIKAKAEG